VSSAGRSPDRYRFEKEGNAAWAAAPPAWWPSWLPVASLRFRLYPDVRPALEHWRRQGRALVVVSNWDVSLGGVLARLGVEPLLSAVLTSAQAGERKPAPGIFERALRIARASAHEAIHIGDSPVEDVEGARGAGIEPVLVCRDSRPSLPGVRAIASLAELAP